MASERVESGRMLWTAFWLGLISAAAVFFGLSGPGVGLTSDSVVYLQAAKNFTFGNGISYYSNGGQLTSLTIFPPLFPLGLSLGSFLGMDALSWARILHALCAGAVTVLAVSLVFFMTGRRRAGLLGGILMLVSVHLNEAYVRLLSEPLFLVWTLGALFALMLYLEEGRRRTLAAAGLLVSLALLTRYAGLALLLTGLVLIVLRSSRRWRDLLIFLSLAAALPLFWLVRCAGVDGNFLGRDIVIRGISLVELVRIPDVLSSFLLPSSLPWPLRWAALAAFLAFAAYVFLRRTPAGDETAKASPRLMTGLWVLGLFCLLHFVCLLGTAVMIGHGYMVNDWRMMLPVFVCASLLVPPLLNHHHLENSGRRIRNVSAVLLALFLALGFLRTARLMKDMVKEGYGYNSKKWSESELARTVRTLADEVPAYSTDPQAFYFYAGRPAVKIPESIDRHLWIPSADTVKEDFRNRRAVAVIFSANRFEPGESWKALSAEIPLSVLFRDASGEIHGFRPAVKEE